MGIKNHSLVPFIFFPLLFFACCFLTVYLCCVESESASHNQDDVMVFELYLLNNYYSRTSYVIVCLVERHIGTPSSVRVYCEGWQTALCSAVLCNAFSDTLAAQPVFLLRLPQQMVKCSFCS